MRSYEALIVRMEMKSRNGGPASERPFLFLFFFLSFFSSFSPVYFVMTSAQLIQWRDDMNLGFSMMTNGL